MNICNYPILFTGLIETTPGQLEYAWVVYRCINHYDVERFDFSTQLGYDTCRYRLKAAPEMTSGRVSVLCVE